MYRPVFGTSSDGVVDVVAVSATSVVAAVVVRALSERGVSDDGEGGDDDNDRTDGSVQMLQVGRDSRASPGYRWRRFLWAVSIL